MRRTQGVETFGNISSPFCTLGTSDLHAKFYGDHRRGTPPSGALNARGVASKIKRRHVSVSHLPMSFLYVIHRDSLIEQNLLSLYEC